MASECSFDVVCKVDLDEVKNAVSQAMKEIGQRYDFKGSVSKVELKDDKVLVLNSDDEVKLKAVKDAKIKVQASIQGDQLRVSGKSRDDLQEVIALFKRDDQGLDLQFTNYRG